MGEQDLGTLPQPCSQAGLRGVLHPREPLLVSGERSSVSCLAWCVDRRWGREEKGKRTISSYACGSHKAVRKAGEYERRVQESQR